MIKLNVHEAKTHLSGYLANLKQGETIVLCERNRPTAEIRQIPALSDASRPIGLAKVIFEVPASFSNRCRGRSSRTSTVPVGDLPGHRSKPRVPHP